MDKQTQILATRNITTPERVIRTAVGAGALMAVVTGTAGTPALIFILSTLGPYLIQTGLHGKDPVYALANHLHVADRLQVWQHSLTTGMFLPILIAGDRISSFIVFTLSAIGGFIATTTMIGRDALERLTGWFSHTKKEVTAGV